MPKCSAGPFEPEVNLSSLVDPPPFSDIGALLDPEKSLHEICDEKCSLLYNHIAPFAVFPPTFSHGYQCRFNHSWLEKYPWLIYSPKLDGVFCGPCALLLPSSMNRRDKGLLVNRPFSNWVKISSTLASHSSLHYHRHCLEMADALKSYVDNPATWVDVMFGGTIQKQINENKQIIWKIV